MITYSESGQGKQAESTVSRESALLSLAHKCGMKDARYVSLEDNVATYFDGVKLLCGTIIVKVEVRY